jgi:hypothetical protein
VDVESSQFSVGSEGMREAGASRYDMSERRNVRKSDRLRKSQDRTLRTEGCGTPTGTCHPESPHFFKGVPPPARCFIVDRLWGSDELLIQRRIKLVERNNRRRDGIG